LLTPVDGVAGLLRLLPHSDFLSLQVVQADLGGDLDHVFLEDHDHVGAAELKKTELLAFMYICADIRR